MKKTYLAAAAVAAIILPVSANAQLSGSKPGLYDVSEVSGWTQVQSADPTVRQWAHSASISQAGTSCNIINAPVPLTNQQYVSGFKAMSEQELMSLLRATADGVSYQEVSPVQAADFDGTDAFRISTRFSAGGLALTSIQAQAIINGNIVSVTCGSVEAAYGQLAPTLERFIDSVNFGSGFTAAKLENSTDAEFPALVSTGAADATILGMSISNQAHQLLFNTTDTE